MTEPYVYREVSKNLEGLRNFRGVALLFTFYNLKHQSGH
jgi:hypothetical protein